jgi:succinate dehydrogenase flavin-adding protein (antitoxin of CptAB toxin-antitoxin module)
MTEATVNFSEFLEKQYLLWQMDNGRASIREFSRWLDINQALVVQWMNGHGKPNMDSTRKLVIKLGPEVYDIFGLPRPPRAIYKLEGAYHTIPSEEIELFESDFDHWLEHWLLTHGFKRIK